jgi:hypothetical protein
MLTKGYVTMSDFEDTKPYDKQELKLYELVFSKISAHFLTQELPKGWMDWDDEYLEEWFVECQVDKHEYWDWESVYSEVDQITQTVMELLKNASNIRG